MATVSFKEDLVVSDEKKAEEIARALQQPKDRSVTARRPVELPKDAGDIWFKRCGK